MIRPFLSVLALAGALCSPAALAQEGRDLAEDPLVETRLREVSRELRCLVCQNETLADSQAKLAQNLRREVRTLIIDGKSDAEIIDFLTERYGDFVLYDPPFKPYTWLLWLGPGLLLLLGGGAWWRIAHHSGTTAEPSLSDDERNRVAALLHRTPPKTRQDSQS